MLSLAGSASTQHNILSQRRLITPVPKQSATIGLPPAAFSNPHACTQLLFSARSTDPTAELVTLEENAFSIVKRAKQAQDPRLVTVYYQSQIAATDWV